MEAIWEVIKSELKKHISPSGYSLWIEPLRPETGAPGELQLICPNPFALRWVQTHYLPLIQQGLVRLGQPLTVRLMASRPGAKKFLPSGTAQLSLPLAGPKNGRGRSLNREFTFARFVVGGSNRLAYHASEALARSDTFFNNILFISSGPGLGKSHLSQAVGNCCTTSVPAASVLYVTAEDFANDMVRALKSGQMARFKERYRGECEVLLLEEVQFLSGKEKIQAELCFTLDTLLERRKKLVITSCYLPGEISHISKELRSRLTGGLITPIGPPDYATRVNILTRKAEDRAVSAPLPVIEYLAEHITGDVRRLESALDCLVARSTLLNEPVTLSLAQEVLQDLKAITPRLTVSHIQQVVCDFYQVSLRELLGRGRQKKLVRARQMGLYFSRLYTQKSVVELGRLFKRSHAAVLHALQTLERDRQLHQRVEQEVKFLGEKLAQAQVRLGEQSGPILHSDV
jgi:chromosomal replication initiator protein|uniref:Chromosomal replication initiator protein DnaA n=1 Tax=Desulfobacca acetoxidans TaxID=60893 RepID=A0A7C5ALP5_9BACT